MHVFGSNVVGAPTTIVYDVIDQWQRHWRRIKAIAKTFDNGRKCVKKWRREMLQDYVI
jgi:hypothetical protein